MRADLLGQVGFALAELGGPLVRALQLLVQLIPTGFECGDAVAGTGELLI